jgi:septal ring factor EnvC (AmiA/AmiB activator)
MEPWIESLVIFAIIIAHIALVGLGFFIFWTAWFIPINKLRVHNQEKEKLEKEILKIEVKKANTEEIIKERKEEYDSISKQIRDKNIELEKLENKHQKILEAVEQSKNKKKGSSVPPKPKKDDSSEPSDETTT